MRIGMKVSPLSVLKAGIPNYIVNLLYALAEIDEKNDYFLYTNRDIDIDLKLPGNFKIIKVTNPSPHFQMWYQVGLPLRLKQDGIDLFHDPVYPLPFYLPVPGVITIHDLTIYTHPSLHSARASIAGKLIPLHLRKAKHIITDSDYTASVLRELFPRTAEKTTVIHLGVSSEFRTGIPFDTLETVSNKYKLSSPFFLFLGTMEPRKNLERLLNAFSIVADKIPHQLVIAGGLGWKYEKLLNMISTHPLRDRIILTGFVEDRDLPAVLTLADFFVYPSLIEGFGLPVLESMACGTPVITSNVTSLPEITGGAAFLIDPFSVDTIANAIITLAENTTLKESLSERGLARAKLFSWKTTALKTLRVYESVVADLR